MVSVETVGEFKPQGQYGSLPSEQPLATWWATAAADNAYTKACSFVPTKNSFTLSPVFYR